MNLLDILKENSEIILAEAVRINSGKEAYSLIRNNKIGAKVDSSYKFNDDDTDKSDSLITLFGKLIKDVGANNAPFAVQLAVNKIPVDQLEAAVNSDLIKNIVSYRNKPWAKEVPGYKEIIQLNGSKINRNEWDKIVENLQKESQKHGKANKGSGSLKDVKELYNDGTWSLQIPTSWEGAKAASYYGKKDEEPKPTHWCTRADKKYYDMYSKNSPLYIVRNTETGKAYQIAFDKLQAYILDQDDVKGDKITTGDLNDIPEKLLKLIKWNGRSLADFKKEFNRTDMKKGELENPQTDFDKAEWESPKDEGDGIVSQVMRNLYNSEGDDNFTTFMVKGKPFKFKKRNNYAKKYYYKDKPDYVVITVLSKNGDIRNDILWPFKYHRGHLVSVSSNYFNNELVKDDGFLFNKVAKVKIASDKKRQDRANIKVNDKENLNFMNRMASLLRDHIKKEYVKNGLLDDSNYLSINTNNRGKKIGTADRENFGNFMPIQFKLEIYPRDPNKYITYGPSAVIEFAVNNFKCKVTNIRGININKETLDETEEVTNKALKNYAKEAVRDEYGSNRRTEYREKSKGAAVYDVDNSKRLQFEDYFPY